MSGLFNRRDLLKFFGAGAVIAPVINGLPDNQVQAKLIAEPSFDLVKPVMSSSSPGFDAFRVGKDECEVTVYVRHKASKTVTRIDCNAFIVEAKSIPIIDVTSFETGGMYRKFIPGFLDTSVTFTATGDVKMNVQDL
jgi:hypothetical protein